MPLPEGFTLRSATTADLDALVEHRRAMFLDMGYTDEAALQSMAEKFRVWLLEKMNAEEYLAWVAITPDANIAAGTGLWLMDWPPHMIGRGARRGNILNVYTNANYRRRGLARELMLAALDWCKKSAIDTVILHASASGKNLYESMGFAPTNEMRLRL